jgi:hypothetical protein
VNDTLFTPETPGAPASAQPGPRPPATASPAVGGPPLVITVLAPPTRSGRAAKPVGQGAIRRNQHGSSYHANDKVLKPWRTAVRDAAVDATGQHAYKAPPKPTRAQKAAGAKRPAPICVRCGVGVRTHGLFLGAVGLTIVATFARPKSDPTRAYPIGQNLGDWDHHGRSISDALTGVVFADDAQIVTGQVVKTYPGGHPDALAVPGVVIRVWEVSAP